MPLANLALNLFIDHVNDEKCCPEYISALYKHRLYTGEIVVVQMTAQPRYISGCLDRDNQRLTR